MTAGIVDVLELVEVDEQQRTRCFVDRHVIDFFLDLFHQAPAIEKPGQAVMVGQPQQTGIALPER